MTVQRIDRWTFTVPSASERTPAGDPVTRIVTIEDERGQQVLRCDCPGGYLGYRRGPCHHVVAVAATLNPKGMVA